MQLVPEEAFPEQAFPVEAFLTLFDRVFQRPILFDRPMVRAVYRVRACVMEHRVRAGIVQHRPNVKAHRLFRFLGRQTGSRD